MNPYVSGEQKVIPAVLVYPILGSEVLLLQKNSDVHRGKWNGFGGKLERGETPRQAARRELAEEAGVSVDLESLEPVGVIQFPDFKPAQDWWVSVFVVDLNQAGIKKGEWIREGREGVLQLHLMEKLSELEMWEGDQHFLPYVLKRQPFMGSLYYEAGRLKHCEILKLPYKLVGTN